MSNNNKTPAIRFKGFTDTWEQRKLGDMCDEFQSGKSIKASDITDSGEYAVYGGNGFRGYTDTYNHDGDYALIGRQGALCGNMNFSSGKAYFTEHAVAVHGNADNDTLFLYYLLNLMNLGQYSGQSAQPGLAVNKIIQLKTKAPKLDEQRLISSFFKQLDSLITLHQRKCDKLIQFKAAMLQKMFPQNDADKPEIRFKGFTDAWEQRELSDEFERFIVPMRDKPKQFGGNIPWTRIEDIEGKYLNDSLSGQYVTDETVKQMNLKIIPKDSLIVSSSATFGVVAVVTQDLITNQTFIGLVPNDNETLDYWYAFFYSNGARRYMKSESAGSTIFYIARESFEKMPIKIPLKSEMLKIGAYFDTIDHLITLHQRKCEKYKSIKAGLIRKLFP
jgi:putative type I restriction enzyme, S subunit